MLQGEIAYRSLGSLLFSFLEFWLLRSQPLGGPEHQPPTPLQLLSSTKTWSKHPPPTLPTRLSKAPIAKAWVNVELTEVGFVPSGLVACCNLSALWLSNALKKQFCVFCSMFIVVFSRRLVLIQVTLWQLGPKVCNSVFRNSLDLSLFKHSSAVTLIYAFIYQNIWFLVVLFASLCLLNLRQECHKYSSEERTHSK